MDTAVRPATLMDLDVVADALTAAFLDDPIMGWAFDPAVRLRRLDALWRFLAGRGYLPAGTSTVLPGGDGAALWMAPGGGLGEAFWSEHGASFASELGGDVDRLGAVGAAMGEHHPAEDHWYLLAIGVRPEAQGRGLGGVLLAHTLALADEHHRPAYLEASSPRSRTLYQRFGFETVSEFRALDSPPLWGMWREPA